MLNPVVGKFTVGFKRLRHCYIVITRYKYVKPCFWSASFAIYLPLFLWLIELALLLLEMKISGHFR